MAIQIAINADEELNSLLEAQIIGARWTDPMNQYLATNPKTTIEDLVSAKKKSLELQSDIKKLRRRNQTLDAKLKTKANPKPTKSK